MALSPTFTIEVPCGCDRFNFTDTTGVYVAGTLAYGAIQITAGTSGSITSVKVDGVEIIGGAVAFNASINQTAADLNSAINAYLAAPNFQSSVLTDTVSVVTTNFTTEYNGAVIVVTATGDMTFSITNMCCGVEGNTGGWGSPNAVNTAIDSATLKYKAPGDIAYTSVDLTALVVASTAATYSLLLSAVDAAATVIDAGEWEFVYEIVEASAAATRSANAFVLPYCEYEVCFDNKLLAFDPNTCEACKGKNESLMLSMRAHIEALKAAADNGETSKFERIMALLDKYCATDKCKCS